MENERDKSFAKRCGYIGIVGRPNAGKSTFLNAVLGQKLAAVSLKPQTTRNRILGVKTVADAQMLFLDTPGINSQHRKTTLNSLLNKEAWEVIGDADILAYLIDGARGWQDADFALLQQIIQRDSTPVMVIMSKYDKLKKFEKKERSDSISSFCDKLNETPNNVGKVSMSPPLSAKQKDTIEVVINQLAQLLPFGEFLFPVEQTTDRDEFFVVGELVREQIFRCLGQELPYQSAVIIDSLDKKKNIISVEGRIIVAQQSQKGMFVGKKGVKIREIGMKTRISLENFWKHKVFLSLRVEVKKDWHENKELAKNFGSFE